MPEITLPSSDFARVTVELDQNYQINRSIWTGRRRAAQLPGAEKWFARAETPPIATELQERLWRAFIIQAAVPANWFKLPVACQQTPVANPTVLSPATSNQVSLTGLPPSLPILRAGQFMTITLASGHRRLVMLIGDLTANELGQAIATFLPGLAGTANAGAAVEIRDPYLKAVLIETRQGWTTEDGLTPFVLDAEEGL